MISQVAVSTRVEAIEVVQKMVEAKLILNIGGLQVLDGDSFFRFSSVCLKIPPHPMLILNFHRTKIGIANRT